MWPRRIFILGGTAIMTAAGCDEMYEVLKIGGVTLLEWIVLVLFVLLFAWIAFSFLSAMAGFAILLIGRKDALGIDPAAPLPTLTRRVAMLLPTYNEDPYRVLARLRAVYESVEDAGRGSHFDWFVLSDSTDPAIWIAEEKVFLRLRADLGSGHLFYRHRPQNTARKSGNIEDWVKRFGSAYDCMLILDADSLMSGDTIVRLAAAMEQHPFVGLIQTLPVIVNGFASSVIALVVGAAALRVGLPPATWLPLAAVIAVSAFACTGLGLVTAAVALRVRETAVLANIVFGILLVFCGTNVALSDLPEWMATVARWLPLTHGIAAARLVASGEPMSAVSGLVGSEAAVGLMYVVIGMALLRFFEAESRRRATLHIA